MSNFLLQKIVFMVKSDLQPMVGVAQLVEHWVVAPVVVGSSPITHPIFHNKRGSQVLPLLLILAQKRAPNSPSFIDFNPKRGKLFSLFY